MAAAEADSPVACTIVDSDVESGTATFTVGPADCSPEIGPISFSTYELPGGQILPYSEQTLIAHADANGAFYGAGSYTLTASLGQALNWQADLYFGDSDNQPPHPNMIDVDAQTGVVADTTTTSTTTTTTTTTTTAPLMISPAAVTAPSSAPVDSVASLTPIPSVAPAVAPVGGSTAVVAPTTTTGPIQQLPATGSSTTGLLVMAGVMTVVGWASLRLARRTV
jgi:LPXTG-motif cell wall-anchored protein